MLAPVPPTNPGTHTLHHEMGAVYTVGRDYVERGLQDVVAGGWAACDIETYGLGLLGRDIKCVTFASPQQAVILDVRDPYQADRVKWAFEELGKIIFHNSPYDVPNLGMAGLWDVRWCRKVTDTLIWARLAEPSEMVRKSLEDCAARYLGLEKATTPLGKVFKELGLKQSEGWKRFDLDRPVYVFGAAMDAIMTARLAPIVRQAAHNRITEGHPWVGSPYGLHGPEAWDLVEREQIINRMMLARSVRGLRIDPEWADVYAERTLPEYRKGVQILELAGVVPGNNGSLIRFLEEAGAVPEQYPRTEKTGAVSTAKDNLKRLHHPVATAFVGVKERDHVQKDYLAKCLELEHHGRIHPRVNLLAAVTGRASMGDPPIHQFPGDARGIVLADEGDSLTSIDWSQVEPVLAANMAKDVEILEDYEAGRGKLYDTIAERAGVSRKVAKVIVLAQMYGEGITKLSLDLDVSIDEAKELREAVFAPMPKVRKLVENMRSLAERYRKVFTLSGRILPIPSNPQWGVHTHKGINYLVQGSAYDTLADALVRVDEAGLGDAVYLSMHDELVVSTSAAEDVRKIMTEPPTRLIEIARRTPVLRTDLLDLGERWAAA